MDKSGSVHPKFGGTFLRFGRASRRNSCLLVKSRTLLIVALAMYLPAVTGIVYYPPFFNAALQKPLSLTPADSVCGVDRSAVYCKSMSDEQAVKSCWPEDCSNSCPYRSSLPHKENAFGRVVSWPTCIVQNTTFQPTNSYSKGQYSVDFPGERPSENCYLELDKNWLIQIKLMGEWSLSVSVWMYNMLDSTQTGTIFDIQNTQGQPLLRLFLQGERLKVQGGGGSSPVTRSEDAWRVPGRRWTHLTVTVYQTSVAVYIDGEHVAPTLYQVPLGVSSDAVSYTVGYSNLGYYVGYMANFGIYMEPLSNRDVTAIIDGILPEIRTRSTCRCPPSHPALKANDMKYCVMNPGDLQDASETYRLNRESTVLEFVNDGNPDTFWVSKPDTPITGQEQHSLELDLRDVFEVRHVDILFYSPLPNVIIIERKANGSDSWTPWQYYSQECVDETGFPEGQPLTSEEDINCLLITDNEEADNTFSRGRIVFDVLRGRPGHADAAADTFTDKLREFTQASMVKVTIRGYPFVANGDEKHRYHSILELQVNATCDCHGHASSCRLTDYPYQCDCNSNTNTKGRLCDQCTEGAFLDPDKNTYAADLCQLCDCSVKGSVNGSSVCDEMGGQCDCKENAGGRSCDTCEAGYYNLREDNPAGCDLCLCHTPGTGNGSNICDVISGTCPCKENVEGDSCDSCKAGHYALDDDNPEGCSACGCDPDGTVEGDSADCDAQSGQCTCKVNAEGRACDRCKDGYYLLETKNPEGCKACNCDSAGSVNSTCDPLTGQCHCKPHVTGRTCSACAEGYYALDADDMELNGCAMQCGCARNGTLGLATRCEAMGGQCRCKESVEGRACDTCRPNTYGFGSHIEGGCSQCMCEKSGTVDGSALCHNVTGQCACKQNADARRCDVCKDGYYGLDSLNMQGCMACMCDAEGTKSGKTCDKMSGQCDCQENAGDIVKGGRTCTSYMDNIDPLFGPEAGGTLVTISGGYFGDYNSSMLTVGTIECPIQADKSSKMMLVCKTGQLTGSDVSLLGGQLAVTWTRADGEQRQAIANFTYMTNPQISSVEPLKTFLMGGINLTVTGENLDSVAYPVMEVTMVYMRDNSSLRTENMYTSPCIVLSGGKMTCPTPIIKDPGEMLQRRRRDVLRDAARVHPRARRQTSAIEKKVNNEHIQFYLGFRLDGVLIYRNMSEANPQYGVIDVYVNPKLSKFEEPESVRMFRPYWPFSQQYLVIKGEDLDYGAKDADYTVMIGDFQCEVIELASNQIKCEPPKQRPDYSEHSHRDGEPHVQVIVGNIDFLAGYLDYEHSFWENLPFRWGVVGGCAGALLLIILLIVCCCCCRKKKEKDDGFDHPQKKFPTLEARENGKKGNAYIQGYNNGSTASYLNPSFSTDLLEILPRDLRGRVEDCLIDYKRMVAGKIIGEGNYGRVHIGRLNDETMTSTIPVAIKTLKENAPGHSEVIQFLEECTMMKDFRHENVLAIIGVVLENDRAFCLLPLMENGDLKSFISNEENLLTVGELIDFGLQIAKGMNYLAEQRFVHRDLACRNCMIDQQLSVKVADFGLARDIYSSEYYRVTDSKRPLPVKWLAHESLDAGVFTTKSDVWSYGVVLWELLTRGCTPYPDIQSYDLKNYLLTGGRMDRPDFSPDEMYTLMIACWDETPGRRPTFYDIILRISDFLEISNTKTVMRDYQSQKIPTVAYRGRSYLSLVQQ